MVAAGGGVAGGFDLTGVDEFLHIAGCGARG